MSDDFRCTAKWIWLDAAGDGELFVRARRTFDLADVPPDATVRIAAGGLYRLWVNGQFAGRGPARSAPWRKRYDILPVGGLLRPGRNVLAVQAIHFGYATASTFEGPGGLWCQLDGGGLHVESDAAWRMSVDPAYQPNTGRRNGCYGPIEIFDARRDEPWREVDFDDAAWQPARELRGPFDPPGPHVEPWTLLIPRGIAQCAESELRPERIARVAEVPDQEFIPEPGKAVANLGAYLLLDVPVEPELTRIDAAESLCTGRSGPAVVRQPSPTDYAQPEQRDAVLILDFGREITGFAWIDVEGNAGAVVDLCYSERLVGGRVQAVVQGVAYADRFILPEGRRRHEVYDWKGFCYLQLTFRNLTRPLTVHGVGVAYSRYPLQPAGRFDCDDPRVSRIWQVGAYTQQLCTHDAMMDCPWREQQQWLGDGRVQLLVLQTAFGERAICRKFLDQFAECQHADGQLPGTAPSRDRRPLTDYCLWWVVGLRDVAILDGAARFGPGWLAALVKLMFWFKARRNADGLLENVPGWTFIDWANLGKNGCSAALNAIYCIALRAAAEMAAAAGIAVHADEWLADARRIERVFHETFWDPKRQLYVDNLIGGRPTECFSQHTQAIAVVANLARTDAAELLQRAMADGSLTRAEPYFSFYLLEALAAAGLGEAAMDFVRRRWGGMLDGGATSFWEEWQVTGTFRDGRWVGRPRSHCHAWSAGVTAWLSRHVLGVRVDSITGQTLTISPLPCGLGRADGIVPTRFGDIRIAWQTAGDRMRIDAAVPEGVTVNLREPSGFEGRTELRRG